ncbi:MULTISPECIES: tyrosine-type recombinase/integrase [Halomonas]|uniref:Integrase n=1 Tax=Halomonas halophila TaxID=29573 RepID=A0ABQ0U6G5_9GAMM|nr:MULTISPECIES: site-specific integrase [Halomonas]MDR5888440.1 integrase arm-type DNA-binding domain-containing protein [Halomonas salina]WJY05783.1 integrase arm-type DNA-binding domain-containing protein [Halomonas halophila]GEK74122.1 integrase [Halomonas halophila]
MPKRAKELTATEVRRLTQKPGFHAVGGVAGLYLSVAKDRDTGEATGAASWILRTKIGNRRRDIGLGGFPEVKLAQARERALDAKDKIKAGIDPVAERKEARSRLLAQQVKEVTFDHCAAKVIAKKQAESSNPKHAQQWENTLKTYASPVLGSMRVEDIEISHVLKVLKPIWSSKHETATRVRQRIEAVLAWATVHGHRSGDNPARWKGNLDASELPKPATVNKGKNHAALPYARAAEFMADLRTREGMAARALEFAVLTAARSNEIRGALWSEIDLEQKVWTIPATRMKAGKEHRVPLSDDAMALLEGLPRIDGNELVFPAPRGGQMSVNTMAAVIKRMNTDKPKDEGYIDPRQDGHAITQHGFRSTFRDWAGECTAYPGEAIEQALAHTIKNAAEAAYRRGDMLDKRRLLMTDWATYLNNTAPKAGTVTPIRKEA